MSHRRTMIVLVLAVFLASFGRSRPETVRASEAPSRALETRAVDPAVAAAAERLAESRVLVPAEIAPLAEALVAESRRRGFSPALVLAVIEVESRFDPFAASAAGALGLMQVMPATGEVLARELGIDWRGERTLFDPIANLRIGLAYLEQMRDRFGDLPTALAAYNRGPGAIGGRVRRGAPIPEGYARRVLSAYAETSVVPMTSS